MKNKFNRSDIPYKDRLLMERYKTVAEHRNEAARVAMLLACVALNNTEGLGLARLTRFAKEHYKLIEDGETGEVFRADKFTVRDLR